MNVVFRADASVQIGTGHVMRCLTLAEELRRQGHQCLFICRDHKGHLGELITTKDFEIHLLSAPGNASPSDNSTDHADWLGVSLQKDARQTLEVLTRYSVDWLVVDHYALDARWERQVGAGVGRIAVIDDLADRYHECALLLDQNLGRQTSDYDEWVPENCTRLIGPQYALLRPEFARFREQSLQRRSNPECKRILISLGGVDRTNVTGQVLRVLSKIPLPSETQLDIVMGSTAPYLADVREQAAQLPVQSTVSVNVSDMAERMYNADLSIGAAGSTSWERCSLGLPSIMLILAANQQLIGRALEEAGCAALVRKSQLSEELGVLVTRFLDSPLELKKMAHAAAAICDGNGNTRLVSEMKGERRS